MAPPPPQEIVQHLNQKYRKPQVDPDWLAECSEWLLSEGGCSVENMQDLKEKVEEQLLKSNLQLSMLHNTGLDTRIAQFTGVLQGVPTLVQILAITDIGISASQLEQVRVAREERMRYGEGNVEGEEDGDVEIEGEGPMPKYPRSQLHFRLSDGLTSFEAIEHRRLPELVLGNTSLGFKMQLNKTCFRNGMAFLEPATVTLLGGDLNEPEEKQLFEFQQSLRIRRGLPLLPEPEVQGDIDQPPLENQPPPPPPPPEPAARSPLRDISPPPVPVFPQRDDDANLEPRRRIPNRSVLKAIPDPSSSGERKIVPLPSRNSNLQTSSIDHEEVRRPSVAERSTLIYAGSSESKPVTSSAAASSSYDLRSSTFKVNTVVEHLDFNMKPTGRQLSRTLPSPSPEPPTPNQGTRLEPSPFDFDFLDEIDENQPPSKNNDKGKGLMQVDLPRKTPENRAGDSSDDYGLMDDENDFADAKFLGEIDRVEKAALEASYNTSRSVPGSSLASGSVGVSSSSFVMVDKGKGTMAKPTSELATQASDVIEIDDSDEEMLEADDKENQPVPTRHVRRRTEDSRSGPAFTQLQSQCMSQKSNGPAVLAEDIIDISD